MCTYVCVLIYCCILSLSVAPDLTFRTARGDDLTGEVRRNVTTPLSLFCGANAVPAATFVEIRRRNATDEVVLNRTELVDSNMQSVRYTLKNLMLSDSDDVFFCAANNSVGLRERSFTLVVQGGWTLIGTHSACQILIAIRMMLAFQKRTCMHYVGIK